LSLKIDLHNHTARGSIDAVNDPDELVELARERGLDATAASGRSGPSTCGSDITSW
jgi:hypothetical protein